MDAFKDMLSALAANWQEALIGGVIVVCAIIVFLGVLKNLFFDKITIKLVRKIVLAALSIVLAMPATALYFVCAQIAFTYYWYAYALVCVATIIGYWLYENTGLRALILYIGNNVIVKYATVVFQALKNKLSQKDIETLVATATTAAQAETQSAISNALVSRVAKTQVKTTTVDDDLKDL